MVFKNWKTEILTIPNLLSLFRLALIPVYISIYLNATTAEGYLLAAMILAVSCLTDLMDGKIARHFNMVSNLGKILDPLADKATQLSLIICLSVQHPALLILVGIFVLKEGFQLIAGGFRLCRGSMLKGAQLSGKICTTILFVSLIFMIMLPQLHVSVVNIITAIDAIVMLVAFVDYINVYCGKENKFQDLNTPGN